MHDLDAPDAVSTARVLRSGGVSRTQLANELAARRWRRHGLAIAEHNGPLSPAQRHRVGQIHAGPQALLTAFTAAELLGLRGWERSETHVLAPAGTRLRANCPVPIRLHLHGSTPVQRAGPRAIEALAPALLRAAATFTGARPACGLLAAAVQQQLLTATDLDSAIRNAPRVRHRAAMRLAVADIGGGSQALSEIDFVRLCRGNHLPEPERQAQRRDSTGRRRYLVASWRRRDGRWVVVEVDGALHLAARQWWADQLRQNELALTDALVLRFPSVVVRCDQARVVEQLRRALLLA